MATPNSYTPYPTSQAYPAYPQAQAPRPPQGGYPGYGAPAAPYGGYGWAAPAYGPYPYAYPYGWYPAFPPRKPPRRPGELYGLILSWIVTVFGALAIICALLVLWLLVSAGSRGALGGLEAVNSLVSIGLYPAVGGVLALWHGIRGIMRRDSRRFELPPAAFFLGLSVLSLGAGVVLWHVNVTPGPVLAVAPLSILCGILPALTILAYVSQRLGNPSSARRVWLSLFWGATLAALLAAIIELVLEVGLVVVASVLGYNVGSTLDNFTQSPNDLPGLIALLVLLSVIAPLVEETMKPLGMVMLIGRISGPAEAFLLGMAGGVGFDMAETITYFGLGQADWAAVAIDRLGAGLLHGLGAGMSGLAWYYLVRGKGVRLRWLRVIGCIGWAVLQHGINNALGFLTLLPDPVGGWLNTPLYLGRLSLGNGIAIYFIYYLLMLSALAFFTGKLAQGERKRRLGPPAPSGALAPTHQADVAPAVAGGTR